MKLRRLLLFVFCFGAFFSLGFTPRADERETYWERQLREKGRMNLPVKPFSQSRLTSCGEAVIVMVFNYAHPESQISEEEVIAYASEQGYYTERKFPYTSPENMVKIAEHYASAVSAGAVHNANEGLALLKEKLTGGDPVIIDILTQLDRPSSGAHFVVVTGLEIDPVNPNKVRVYFNDPLTGRNRSAYWLGKGGVWNAWMDNRDPGGSGWWMVIASP